MVHMLWPNFSPFMWASLESHIKISEHVLLIRHRFVLSPIMYHIIIMSMTDYKTQRSLKREPCEKKIHGITFSTRPELAKATCQLFHSTMKAALVAVVVLVGLLGNAEGRVGEEKPNRWPTGRAEGNVVVDEPQDESSTLEAGEEEEDELMDYVVGFKQPEVNSLGSSMAQQEMVYAMSSAFTTLSGPFKVHTMIPRFASAGVMLSARVSTLLGLYA
jgi:hypothetical protein